MQTRRFKTARTHTHTRIHAHTHTHPHTRIAIQEEGSTVGDDVGVVVVAEVVGVVVFPVNSNNGMIERTHTTHRKRHSRQKDTKE